MRRRVGSARLVRVLALRRLTERPLRSCLTAIGVAAGVAFLFSVLLLNTQLATSAQQTSAVLTGSRLLQVTSASPGGLPEALVGELAADREVAVAAPLLLRRSTLSRGSRTAGVFLVGVTPQIGELGPRASTPLNPSARGSSNGSGMFVSRALAHRLHADSGVELDVHAPSGVTQTSVAGVASSPLLDRINGGMAAVIALPDAQAMFGRTGQVDQILLLARPGTNIGVLQDRVADAVAGVGVVGPPGNRAGDASQELQIYVKITQLLGILTLITASVLVFNTMSMALAERRTELALARSFGATRRQLLVAALGEAAALGVAGTLVGLVAGGLVARLVVAPARHFYRSVSPVDIPTHLEWRVGPLVLSAVAGVGVAVFGALVPARRTARATPIDVLRPAAAYEWRDRGHRARATALAAAGAAVFTTGVALAFHTTSTRLTDFTPTAVSVFVIFTGAVMLVPTAVPLAAAATASMLSRISRTTGRFAGDALRSNPRRTTFSVSFLLLPLAALVATTLAFDGALSKYNGLSHTMVTAPLNVDADSFVGFTATQPLTEGDQAALAKVPGVRSVLGYQYAFVTLPDHTQALMNAIPLTEARRAGVSEMVRDARLADDPVAFDHGLEAGQVAASRLAAQDLHLQQGSTLTLPTPAGPHIFTIATIVDFPATRDTLFIDRDTYRATWGDGGVARYAIFPSAGTSVDFLHRRLQEAITTAHMPALVRTRAQAAAQLITGAANLATLARGMMLAGLLFAALALVNGSFTAIAERRWMFGLQRALGTTNRQIGRSLALEALAIGVIASIGGAVIGVGLGTVLTRMIGIQGATRVRPTVPWAFLGATIVLGAFIAVASTLYPRRTARRLSIIETLRYE